MLFGFEFLCIYAALPRTDASRVSVFLYLAPFVVALCLPLFEPTEKLAPAQMAGLVAAFAALAYAFQEGFTAGRPAQWTGDALAVLAAFVWGATTLVVRATTLSHAAPEKTLFYQLAVSAVVLETASLVAGERLAVERPAGVGLGLARVPVARRRVRELSHLVLAAAALSRRRGCRRSRS